MIARFEWIFFLFFFLLTYNQKRLRKRGRERKREREEKMANVKVHSRNSLPACTYICISISSTDPILFRLLLSSIDRILNIFWWNAVMFVHRHWIFISILGCKILFKKKLGKKKRIIDVWEIEIEIVDVFMHFFRKI